MAGDGNIGHGWNRHCTYPRRTQPAQSCFLPDSGRLRMETEVPDQDQSRGTRPNMDDDSHWFVQGISPSVRALEQVIGELAANDVPVLLMAEAGAGKRATAHRIHHLSARRLEPFQVVACSGLSLESGPSEPQFESGTVFLEEIGDLSAASQWNLLERVAKADGNGRNPTTAR